MLDSLRLFFRQLLCHHPEIENSSESFFSGDVFIVKSTSQCCSCKKHFTLSQIVNDYPNNYIFHKNVMSEYWINKIRNGYMDQKQ